MDIVDSQVHAWRRGDGDAARDPSGMGVEAPDLLRELDAAGVAAAVVVSPNSIYDNDSAFALETAGRAPDRLWAVGPVDLEAADPAGFVRRWATDARAAGLRLVFRGAANSDLVASASARAALRAMEELRIPLCIWAPADPAVVETVARDHQDLQVIVDHTGVAFSAPMTGTRLEEDGRAVLELARHPNVAVKLTGIPALSAEGFPYKDVWPWAGALLESFGPRRAMWGTDWTRVRGRASYPESLGWITESGLLDRAGLGAVLGATARSIYRRLPPPRDRAQRRPVTGPGLAARTRSRPATS